MHDICDELEERSNRVTMFTSWGDEEGVIASALRLVGCSASYVIDFGGGQPSSVLSRPRSLVSVTIELAMVAACR